MLIYVLPVPLSTLFPASWKIVAVPVPFLIEQWRDVSMIAHRDVANQDYVLQYYQTYYDSHCGLFGREFEQSSVANGKNNRGVHFTRNCRPHFEHSNDVRLRTLI